MIKHENDLIQNDKNRPENRRGIQEICRMESIYVQSYFIFDSAPFQIARQFYFTLQPDRKVDDDDYIKERMRESDKKDDPSQKIDTLDYIQSTLED